jgi:hypothetical protein
MEYIKVQFPPDTPDEDYDYPNERVDISVRVVVWWRWDYQIKQMVPFYTPAPNITLSNELKELIMVKPKFGLKQVGARYAIEEPRFGRYNFTDKRWEIEGITGSTTVLAFLQLPEFKPQ